MKKLFLPYLILAMTLISIPAFTEHPSDHPNGNLRVLASRLASLTGQLDFGARRIVGYYPTYSQRYALEHIQFYNRSAMDFNRTVSYNYNDSYYLRNLFRRLERDAYYAEQTFGDLYDRYPNYRNSFNENQNFKKDEGMNMLSHPGEDNLREVLHESKEVLQQIRNIIGY